MSVPEKARILIADDEIRIRELLSKKLTQEGYRCTMAPDGSRAIEELKNGQFDLALLDINMPGKSGIDVLEEIKHSYSDTAAIMITAVADVHMAIRAMNMGASDYITKPVDLGTLMISIEGSLEKRRLILENRQYQLHLEEMVREQTEKIRKSFLNAVTSLAYALEAKDEYTSGHSQRVTSIAVAIAREMGMPPEKIEKIRLGGLLHDVGKIGVREAVLNKPGKLTEAELEHVRTHCVLGEHILAPIIEDVEILEMVRHHHERWDGKGYPDGIASEGLAHGTGVLATAEAYATMVSPGAMALTVADTYDAMTSDRPYRQAMSDEIACAELEKCKGKQFNPALVDALIRVLSKGEKL